jgi:hypothetical protein
MVMVFKTDFCGVNDPRELVSAGPLTPLIIENLNIIDFLGEYDAKC